MNEKNVKITKRSHAFKRYASSYVEILNSFNPELQLKDNKLIDLLNELKGFKFMTTLVLVFKKKESDDKRKYHTFYSNSIGEAIINESDNDDVSESFYTTVISNI